MEQARERFGDSLLTVIASGHGDRFYEPEGMGHGRTLYNEVLRTVLILHYPPAVSAGVVETSAASVDLAPTLASLFGTSPSGSIDGVNLLETSLPARLIVSELGDLKAFLAGELKFLYCPDEVTVDVYGLPLPTLSERDAYLEGRFGLDDIATSWPDIADLLPWLASDPESEFVELDAETARRLRALGYIR